LTGLKLLIIAHVTKLVDFSPFLIAQLIVVDQKYFVPVQYSLYWIFFPSHQSETAANQWLFSSSLILLKKLTDFISEKRVLYFFISIT
jgi:hypothetical protein